MATNVTTLDTPAASAVKAKARTDTPEVLKPASGSGDFCGRKALINIAVAASEPGGKDAVFLGVAGTGFLVPRGKNWIVPVELANVLRDANVRTWERDADDKNYVAVDSPRFSFMATDLDVDPVDLAASAANAPATA